MKHGLAIQTCGSIVVAGGFASAELAARYLDACPGSALAWQLNLVVFRAFEDARVAASPLHPLFGPATLPLSLGLAVLALTLGILRLRLAVAATANLGFVAAVLLAHAWIAAPRAVATVSAAGFAPQIGPETGVVALMLAASFAACAASHLAFVRAIRIEASGASVVSAGAATGSADSTPQQSP